MISENRLHYSVNVARKAYKIAKSLGKSENFARRCFALGWNHDIGYEFDPDNHADVGAEILAEFDDTEAIKFHGEVPEIKSDEWRILALADMTTSPTGEEVSLDDRLAEIEERYGNDHKWYISSKRLCDELKKEYRGILDNRGNLV